MADYTNTSDDSLITGSADADTITNSGINVTINAGNGNDSITNEGSNVTINAGDGEDTVTNSGSNVSISGGAGGDSVYNNGSNVSIGGDAGNDIITNEGSNATIYGGEGDDTVTNSVEGVMIDGGGGADSISNSGVNGTINGGANSDTIINTGNNITINGDAGDDFITNNANNVSINAGAGNDTITNTTEGVVIDGGEGNDSITNGGDNVTVTGGAGADSIFNNSDYATIDGGADNDYIYNSGKNALFRYSAGNDTIEGFGASSTLQIDGTIKSITLADGTISFSVGTASITLKDSPDLEELNIIDGSNVPIAFSNIAINMAQGGNSFENTFSNVTINGSNGNDTILNSGSEVLLNGGDGADSIVNYSSNISINGGAGDDTIYNEGANVLIEYNGGNDLIQGFDSTTSLKVTSGTLGNITSDGKDIFVQVGSDTVTLAGAAEITTDNLKILDNKGSLASFNYTDNSNNADTVENFFDDITISTGGGTDSINNHGADVSIDGGSGNDIIINDGANVTISSAAGNDSITNSGINTFFEYKGGSLYVDGFNDTSTLKIASGNVSNITSNGKDIFVKVGNNTISLAGAFEVVTTQFNILKSNDSPISSFDYDGATTAETVENHFDEISIKGDGGTDNITNHGVNVTIVGGGAADSITNYGANATINAGDGANYIKNEGTDASILSGSGADSIINSGANAYINAGAGNNYIDNSGAAVEISVGGSNDTIINTAANVLISASGGKNYITNSGESVEITGGNSNDNISNEGDSVIITGGAGADSISNKGEGVTISGGDGNDSISNDGDNVTINAGKGNDTIINSGANVVIEYSSVSGADVIEGFSASSTLQIEGSVTSATSDGTDLILAINSSNSITLKNALEIETLNIQADNDPLENFVIKGTAGDDTLTNHFDDLTINALDGADSIVNSGSNVTINAGTGNDTIINSGDNYGVVINYASGDGNDYISGFGDNTTFSLTSGTVTAVTSTDGKNLVLAIGNGSVTLENALELSQPNIYDSKGELVTLPAYTINLPEGGGSTTNDRDGSTINGSGNDDTITNTGSNVSINASNGNDTIINEGSDVTIYGYLGDDYISNTGYDVVIKYGSAEGNDTIEGFNSGTTLSLTNNSASEVNLTSDGKNVFVKVDSNTITLTDAFELGSLSIFDNIGNLVGFNYTGTENADSVDNYFAEITVDALGDDDTINNYGGYVSINAGAGADSIYNAEEAEYSTITGGAGADSITNNGAYALIDAGADNDVITNTGSNVSINAGAGDNTIINGADANVIIQYSGEGSDLVKGFNDSSTLQVMSGSVESLTSDGTDLFLQVGGKIVSLEGAFDLEQLNIVNAAESAITLPDIEINLPASGGSVSNYFERATINGFAGNDTIYNYAESAIINAGDGGNVIYNDGAAGVSITGGAGADSIYNNGATATINAGAGDDTITSESYDALIQYSGGNDLIQGFNDGSTLQLMAADKVDKVTSNGTDLFLQVDGGTISLEGAFELYSLSVADKDGNIIELPGMEINGTTGNDTISNDRDKATISGLDGDDDISNSGVAVSINGGAGADSIDNSGNSATINGGLGDDYISNNGASVLFQYDGGNDTISGFDETSTLKISGTIGNITSNQNDLFLTVGQNTITVESAFYLETLNISDTNGNALNFNYTGTDAAESLDNYFNGIMINADAGDDSINNYGASVTINAGAGNDTVYNTGSSAVIDGGEGNDVITNENGDYATVTGGAGDDSLIISSGGVLIQYAAGDGNDSISGFNQDSTLKVTSGTVSNITSDGTNLFVAVGENTITIEEGFSYEGNILDAGGNSVALNFNGTDAAESLDNYFENISINGGAGNDTINNYVANVTINGGADNDIITNDNNDSATISGGAGNDTIRNLSGTLTFQYNSGDGNDLIQGFDDTSTLQILSNKVDGLTSDGTNLILQVGEGAISLEGAFQLNSLSVVDSSGNAIELPGMEIFGTAGSDSAIFNSYDKATISGLDGNDSIDNTGVAVSINGGAGDDTITSNGDLATILGGTGNDSIVNNGGTSVLFQYEGGNDYIGGFTDNSTLKVSGTINNVTSDNVNVFVAVGENTITVDSAFDYLSNILDADGKAVDLNYKGTDGNDSVDNYFENVTVNAGKGNDTITNYASNVTLNGGADDDTIVNGSGSDVLIQYNAGDGNDLIQDFAVNATLQIMSGSVGNVTSDNMDLFVVVGENTITVGSGFGNESLIVDAGGSAVNLNYNGTDAAESLNNYFNDITINAGKGNDIINNYASNIVFQYNAGDGNDTIYGFDSTTTLEVGGGLTGDYSITDNGTDVFVSFGGGSIALMGAKAFGNPNINGGIENEHWYWDNIGSTSSPAYVASYGTYSDRPVTVSGVKGISGLELSGKTVTVGLSALNQTDIDISSENNDYKLALAGGIAGSSTKGETWSLSGTTANYTAAATIEGYDLDDNKIVYTPASGGETLTVSGVKSTSGLTFGNNTVTVAAAALDTLNVTITDGYSLTLASDVNSSSTTAAAWDYANNVATHTAVATVAGYNLSNNQIIYTGNSGGETFTVSGVKDTNGLSLSGNTVTVKNSALNQTTVSVSNGYSLALGNDVSQSSTKDSVWAYSNNIATYTGTATTAGYSLSGAQIVYNTASGGETFFVTGVKSKDGLNLSGNTVTVAESALNNKDVTINDSNYSLTLASGVAASSTTKATWSLSSGVATYTAEATVAGYSVNNKQIKYTPASGGATLSVSGVKDTNGLSLSGNTVTVAESALNKSNVTISDSNYSLTLASDVATPSATKESWSLSGSTATYTGAATSEGYSINNKQIVYTPATSGETFTVSGVKNTSGLTFNNKTVTVAASALNQAAVSISSGYSLALGNDVTKSSVEADNWSLSGTTATYKGGAATAGYSLSGSQIVYIPASSGETFTLSGVTSTGGITVSDKTVTLVNKNLSKENTVTISDGYTLALGSDVQKGASIGAGWLFENNIATYQSGSMTAGYSLVDNQISYVATSLEGAVFAELNGIAEDSTLATYDEGVTLTADNFAGNVSVISALNRKFELTNGDYNGNAFYGTSKVDNITNGGANIAISGNDGNDKINNSGTFVTINGGAGDDKVTMNAASTSSIGGAGNIFAYSSGDGKDILYNFNGEEDKLQILSGTAQASVKGKDAIFKVGTGRVTIKDAASNNLTITVVGASESEVLSKNTYTTNGIISGDTITLSTSVKKSYTQAETISVVDGSWLKDGISIIGSGEAGSLTGGEGKDTLISNREGEFELTGGEGHDVFVYTGGNVTINDYSKIGANGMDKVSVASSLNNTNFSFDGDDVILNYGNGNELTIKYGKETDITFAGRKSTVRNYTDDGILESKKKSLTLAPDTEGSFSATKYKKLVTVDGSAVDNNIQITGNNKGNYIIAAQGNTTISGGKGKDTLVGGDGDDVFIYENKTGNKTIRNFGEDDILSLGKNVSISQFNVKKGNAVLKVGKNTITVEGMAKGQFTFVEDGETKTYDNEKIIGADGNSITLSSDAKGAYDLGASNYSDYTNISAEFSKKAVRLLGNSTANSLIGGTGRDSLVGNAGNDTLWGGAGNDTLTGGTGNDTFVYQAGEGTDTIADYSSGDLLRILDKKGNVISRGAIKNATFDDDDLTLAIKGGGKLVLTDVGTEGTVTVNVNGTNQTF